MDFSSRFEEVWKKSDFMTVAEPDPRCIYAQSFEEWAQELCDTATGPGTYLARINSSQVLLQERFFEYRAAIPKRHRARTGSSTGHICVFDVYEAAYQRLKKAELMLKPPALAALEPVPPPPSLPSPPPPPQIAGIFLGEVEE